MRPSLLLGGHGLLLGWHGPLGPLVAQYDRWSRATPDLARVLGRPDRDLPAPPVLGRAESETRVAWCEDDGAWLGTITGDTPPRCVLPGATSVAMGGGTLFAADEDGIVALDLTRDAEPDRVVAERRAGVQMAACSLREESILIYSYDGDPSWGAVTRHRGTTTAVRHRTPRPIRDLGIAAAGTRAGVGLELEGGAVRFALLGPEGKVVERPHPVFDRSEGPLAHPQVVWIERRFWVLARRTQTGALVAISSDGSRGFTLPEVQGPFSAAYYRSHVHVLEVMHDADDAEMRLWRCDAMGRSPQQRRDLIVVPEALARRQCLEARGVLRGLSLQYGRTAGYRGTGQRASLDDETAELRLTEETGALTVALAAHEASWILRVSKAGAEEPSLADPPGSVLRLARWIRHRLSSEARQRYEQERAHAETLADMLDATLTRFELAGDGRWLELELPSLPAPDVLHRWLERVR
ncbi:MAG: hypothetical protein AB8I08_18845 [Sandaracinaceae bacterium]